MSCTTDNSVDTMSGLSIIVEVAMRSDIALPMCQVFEHGAPGLAAGLRVGKHISCER